MHVERGFCLQYVERGFCLVNVERGFCLQYVERVFCLVNGIAEGTYKVQSLSLSLSLHTVLLL